MSRLRAVIPAIASIGVAFIMIGCGSDKGMSSMGSEDSMTAPAAKLASEPTATVAAIVTGNGAPVTGASVAFSRSISGRVTDYRWSGTTDSNGRVEIDIVVSSGGASGYYLARATSGGETIGEWGSIPINGGRTTEILMPVGERVQITSTSAAASKTVFRVRVENISTAKPYIASGAFSTPVGASGPAPIGSGEAYEFSFDAGPGSRLSFATMFVHSNGLFYAPDEDGIALWDGSQQISGDVTSQVMLWDSGTEVNQEPGTGADQAPRQSGANSGAADPTSTVRLAPDTFSNLPAASDVVKVTVTPTSATGFTVRIENVSDAATLTTAGGDALAVPLAPGVFVVHTDPGPLFTDGEADPGDGLEALAEDGNPVGLADALAEMTGVMTILAPVAWAVHSGTGVIFTEGSADLGEGLEDLAEDGNPAVLAGSLAGKSNVASSGAAAVPEGASDPGPVLPGGAYSFVISAATGSKLSFATMFVQSNDYFYGPDDEGLALWTSGGNPVSGDVTSMISLWDAGTETDQIPGVGLDQPLRQSGANTGAADASAMVQSAEGAFDSLPMTSDVIRVTITPLN